MQHIILCGMRFKVTKNLYEALQDLRYEDAPRILWIDALCINQKDLAERSEQVQKMGLVYRKATCVMGYLGRPIDNLAISAIRAFEHYHLSDPIWREWLAKTDWHVAKSEDHDELFRNNQSSTALDMCKQRLWSPVGQLTYNDLADIVSKSLWWTRVWTLQEACLASDLVIMLGPVKIPGMLLYALVVHIAEHRSCKSRADFAWTWGNLSAKFVIITNNGYNTVASNTSVRESYVAFSKQQRDRPTYGADNTAENRALLALAESYLCDVRKLYNRIALFTMLQVRSRQCSDPKDKVFGFAGLSPFPIRVDYSMPRDRVYANFAFEYICFSSTLDILSAICSEDAPREALSWVPRLNSEQPEGLSFSDCLISEILAQEPRKLIITRLDEWDPFGQDEAHPSIIDDSILGLEGATVDRVAMTKQSVDLKTLGEYKSKLHEWWDVLQNEATILIGRQIRGNLLNAFVKMVTLDEDSIVSEHFRSLEAAMPALRRSAHLMVHRSLIVTEQGYIGTSSMHTKPGDIVCILRGGRVSYVLREMDKRIEQEETLQKCYQFIGDAYVCGWMHDKQTREYREQRPLETFCLV